MVLVGARVLGGDIRASGSVRGLQGMLEVGKAGP